MARQFGLSTWMVMLILKTQINVTFDLTGFSMLNIVEWLIVNKLDFFIGSTFLIILLLRTQRWTLGFQGLMTLADIQKG